jgi:hypothetical protein
MDSYHIAASANGFALVARSTDGREKCLGTFVSEDAANRWLIARLSWQNFASLGRWAGERHPV